MLIYVAGPFSANTPEDIIGNITLAAKIGLELSLMGHSVIVPHMNSAYRDLLGLDDTGMTWERYMLADETIIARCDAMVMTPDWGKSKGATRENDYAKNLRIPWYVYPDVPQLHPTEVRCPQQAKGFAEILGIMYRTMLQKNSDYSPNNILATGDIGVIVRIWDKVARMMNLIGFQFELVGSGSFIAQGKPNFESIDDNIMDLAVYSIIFKLLRQGIWGK